MLNNAIKVLEYTFFVTLDRELCAAFPVLSGGNIVNLAKLSGKIIAVIETALIGNLSDGHIGIVQQIFRFLNPVL